MAKAAAVASLQRIDTGSLQESLSAVVDAGLYIYVSEMSAQDRGVTEGDLEGKGAGFAMPSNLVELTFAADRVLTY